MRQALIAARIQLHDCIFTAFTCNVVEQVVMEFKHPTDGKKVPLLLPPRSLLVMNGEARYLWGHG